MLGKKLKSAWEILKLLPKAISNLDNVIEGWRNDAKFENGELPEEQMEEILRRRAICEGCPFMSRNATENGSYYSPRTDDHCIQCGCPISKKTAALNENCGIEEYNRRHKKRPLPLKWEAYNKNKANDEHTETSG